MTQHQSIQVSSHKIIFYSLIVLGNLVTIGSPLNLVISIPEILYVIYLIVYNKIDQAIFYHLVFVITSISATSAMGMSDDSISIYSYSRLKLVGPVGASYVIAIILLLLSLGKPASLPKKSLLYSLFRGLLSLALLGTFVGFIGFVLDRNYSVEGVLDYGIYIYIIIVNIYVLLLNYKKELVKQFYDNALPLLIASVYASFIAYFFLNVSTSYGGLDNIILKADLTYYSAILILAIFLVNKKVSILLPFILLSVMNLNSSSGKEIIIIGIALILFLVGLFRSISNKKNLTFLYYVFFAVIIAVVLVTGFENTSSDSLFSMKIGAVSSVFSSDISEIDESPYIRISEILNIGQGFIQRPYLIPFGAGYGGYFVDYLQMLSGLDLEKGGFSHADVASGFFHTAHDTFCVVPLLNGVFGFWILIKCSLRYIKRIKNNIFAFAAIPWLLLTFYFNSQLALTGLFLLFASEHDTGITDVKNS